MSSSVECAGTSLSVSVGQLRTPTLSLFQKRLFDEVRKHCDGENFSTFCNFNGIESPTFEWFDTDNEVLQRFMDACNAKENDELHAAVVFHGTAAHNVNKILTKGLDPSLRRGQAYGPGEYFGKNPGVSSTYCKGGKQMCVFLVLVPKSDYVKGKEIHHFRVPSDMVVVENNTHQLPIGILEFVSVSAEALSASWANKQRLQKLSDEVREKEKQVREGTTKATIIQKIIQRELEHAGTIYNRNRAILSEASKKEIAMYAYEGYDEEFLNFFFDGGLPKPNQGHANEEFCSMAPKTVEALTQDYDEAMSKLNKAQNKDKPSPKILRHTAKSSKYRNKFPSITSPTGPFPNHQLSAPTTTRTSPFLLSQFNSLSAGNYSGRLTRLRAHAYNAMTLPPPLPPPPPPRVPSALFGQPVTASGSFCPPATGVGSDLQIPSLPSVFGRPASENPSIFHPSIVGGTHSQAARSSLQSPDTFFPKGHPATGITSSTGSFQVLQDAWLDRAQESPSS